MIMTHVVHGDRIAWEPQTPEQLCENVEGDLNIGDGLQDGLVKFGGC
jgi:hypothetical protein